MAPTPSLAFATAPSTASPPANTPNSRPGRHGPNPVPQRGRACAVAVKDSIPRPATTNVKRFIALYLPLNGVHHFVMAGERRSPELRLPWADGGSQAGPVPPF